MFYLTDWLKFKFKNQKPVIEISLTYFLTATLAYLQKLPAVNKENLAIYIIYKQW